MQIIFCLWEKAKMPSFFFPLCSQGHKIPMDSLKQLLIGQLLPIEYHHAGSMVTGIKPVQLSSLLQHCHFVRGQPVSLSLLNPFERQLKAIFQQEGEIGRVPPA